MLSNGSVLIILVLPGRFKCRCMRIPGTPYHLGLLQIRYYVPRIPELHNLAVCSAQKRLLCADNIYRSPEVVVGMLNQPKDTVSIFPLGSSS